MAETNQPKNFLSFLPVSLFGGIIGLCGLTFSWQWAHETFNIPDAIKNIFSAITILLFLLLTATYLLKLYKYPSLVKAEFKNPVSINFFATFIISLLLLPGLILPYNKNIAVIMWCTAAVLMLLFSIYVLRNWLDHTQDVGNALPVWVVPVVGTLDVPIVGSKLPVTGIHEICLLFFAIGLLFTLILLPVIFSRLLFQPPMPEPLQPTLLIMAAPFALLFSDYELLTGSQDMIASIFYYGDLFVLLVFGSKILLLPKCCPFRVTWWAVGFPLAATTIAAFRYAAHKQAWVFKIVAAALLAVTTIVMVYLLVQTFYRIATKHLFLARPAAEKSTEALQPAFHKI